MKFLCFTKCRALAKSNPGRRKRIKDGGGLFFEIEGGKPPRWIFIYSDERVVFLGNWPEMGLKKARQAADALFL